MEQYELGRYSGLNLNSVRIAIAEDKPLSNVVISLLQRETERESQLSAMH